MHSLGGSYGNFRIPHHDRILRTGKSPSAVRDTPQTSRSRHAPSPGQLDSNLREKSTALAGGTHALTDRPRPSHRSRPVVADWRRNLLRLGCTESLCVAGRHRLPCAELVGRLSRRYTRASPSLPATALRILRRPHRRQLWRPRPDGWPCPFRLHASADRDRLAGGVSDALDPVIPCDPRARRIPHFVLALRPDRASYLARDRQCSAALEACRQFLGRKVPAV